jgi:hypothetical protein
LPPTSPSCRSCCGRCEAGDCREAKLSTFPPPPRVSYLIQIPKTIRLKFNRCRALSSPPLPSVRAVYVRTRPQRGPAGVFSISVKQDDAERREKQAEGIPPRLSWKNSRPQYLHVSGFLCLWRKLSPARRALCSLSFLRQSSLHVGRLRFGHGFPQRPLSGSSRSTGARHGRGGLALCSLSVQ